jgi:primary-amine oxidase
MARTSEIEQDTQERGASVHPLEPLSEAEVEAVVVTVKADQRMTATTRFVTVVLREPDKETVLVYAPGSAVEREALVILLDNASGECVEALVSLTPSAVTSWRILEGVQPAIMLDEFVECEEAVKRSPEFLEALRKRGVTDIDLVMVDPWSAGNYGVEPEEDRGKRLARALAWVRSDPTDNGYARPLDGVVAVVDLNKMEVLRVEDHGVVPLPPEPANWTRGHITQTRNGLQPLEISQPEGPSFAVDGHEIRWQKWRFRIGFTPREGLVLYTVGYEDQRRVRPILYRASLSDMVVPYGDPSEADFRKNAFDIGEYGIGQLANSLTLGCDCLGQIHYFDAHMVNSRGALATIKNAICLHEEDNGILWKHTDWRTKEVEVRRSRRLIVSFIATVGNYEYGFYWNFYQDGSLQLEIKLTGVVNTTAVMPGEKPKHGTEIAPQLNAPYHQHIFNARLDMSVDGTSNSVYEVNAERSPRGDENPHGNAFVARQTLFEREKDAQRLCNMTSSRYWKVVNPSVENRMNQPVGYRLLPAENAVPFAHDDAAVIKRAGFLTRHLWVTPYRADENYAAGDYPNQRADGDGLPQWTEANRPIADTDVVVWYTFGHTHIPRLEDWPVMPVHSMGFMLKPDGFFHSNPAMDLPPSESHDSCDHSGEGSCCHTD